MTKSLERNVNVFFVFTALFLPLSMLLVGYTTDFYPFSRFEMFSNSVLPASGYVFLNNDNRQVIHLRSYLGERGYWTIVGYIGRNLKTANVRDDICLEMGKKFFPTVASFSILEFSILPKDVIPPNKPKPVWEFTCPR